MGVRIVSLPATGELRLGATPVVAGQFVPANQLANLILQPAPHRNDGNSASPSFIFQVRDDGGTANGGQDTDPAPDTITLRVTGVNDPPSGMNRTIQFLPGFPRNISLNDFGYSDPNDTPANGLLSVLITTLPSSGELRLGTTPVLAGQRIPLAQLGNLNFLGGTFDTSFTFQVQDDGGTDNGGVDMDPIPRTIELRPGQGGNAPNGINTSVTTNEDQVYTFRLADFPFSDADGNNLLSVRIGRLPVRGLLQLGGVDLVFNQVVSAHDITSGNLRFIPLPVNASGTFFADFTFHIQDDGGTANGGADFDTTANTVQIRVNEVNDAPAGVDHTIHLGGAAARTLALADFPFNDHSDDPADGLQAVRIVSLPTDGTLTHNNLPVTAGQLVSAADLAAGKLVYTPSSAQPPLVSFTFQVQDDGGTALGGIDFDPSPNTLIVIRDANQPPSGSDVTLSMPEDSVLSITTAQIPFADPNEILPNSLAGVTILSLPAAGSLILFGAPVAAGTFVPRFSALEGGHLKFHPAADQHGSAYARFTYRVHDDGGTAFGGIDVDPVERTATIDVISRNDPPVIQVGPAVSVADDSGPQTLVGWATLSPGPPNEGAQHLTSLVHANSNPDLFSVAPTVNAAGTLTFTPRPNARGTAQVTIVVKDDGGTANGGIDTSGQRTFTIEITKSHPWSNVVSRLDVTGDGFITPGDALAVINHLNAFGSGAVPGSAAAGPPFYDTIPDNVIAPADALAVINHLNAFLAGEAESAAAAPPEVPTVPIVPPDILALLALDVATHRRRR
jgi:hypothetical protein